MFVIVLKIVVVKNVALCFIIKLWVWIYKYYKEVKKNGMIGDYNITFVNRLYIEVYVYSVYDL